MGQKLIAGDETVQPEFDKWDRIVSNHPETIEAKRRAAEEWETTNRPLFEAALPVGQPGTPPYSSNSGKFRDPLI